MDLAHQLSHFLLTGGAAWVRELDFEIVNAAVGDVTFSMPNHPGLVHGGGVICGQAIMSGMDTGMVFVMASYLDGPDDERGFTTVQLQTSFERAAPADTEFLTFHAYATRAGRRVVFGQIDCTLPDGKRCATATTQYLWL